MKRLTLTSWILQYGSLQLMASFQRSTSGCTECSNTQQLLYGWIVIMMV